ncbi:hypothetical protein F0562_019779 [Nyssa sinensis]|uniref:Uncharacterized protein n=1 Tax=Nyssa sinensis TaxID=561372 RepID=A0A5J5BQT1_9ASTE|nr:hypothetical protein F0562_019779 [Nyssa sinensis]
MDEVTTLNVGPLAVFCRGRFGRFGNSAIDEANLVFGVEGNEHRLTPCGVIGFRQWLRNQNNTGIVRAVEKQVVTGIIKFLGRLGAFNIGSHNVGSSVDSNLEKTTK